MCLWLLYSTAGYSAPPKEWQSLYRQAYEEPAEALEKADALLVDTATTDEWPHVIAATALYHLNRFAESQTRLIDVESRIDDASASILHVVTHRLMGQNFYRMGGFDQSLNQALKAKLFAQQTGQRDEEAQSTNLIAAVYLRSGKIELALDSFEQALQHFESIGSKADIAKVKNNLAAVYVEMGQLDKAESYLQDTLVLATELNRSTTIVTAYVNRIELLAKQGRFVEAEDAVEICVQQAIDFNLPSYEVWCLKAAAEMYQLNKNNTDAIGRAQQAYDMAKSQNLHQVSIELGKLLVGLLAVEGDYQLALDMSGQTLIQVERLRDQVLTLKLDEVKALNEVEQTRSQLQLMQQQNELQQQRQRMTWIGIGVLIPMLIAALFLLRSKQRLVHALNDQQSRTEGALEDMRVAKEENERLAKIDHLTGLNNRRELSRLLRAICGQVDSTQASILMIDIDHFKQVNDKYGHNAGDMVLTEISTILQQMMPDTACLSRWGGEEFMVLLPNTGPQDATNLAERFRVSIEDLQLTYSEQNVRVTVSIGIDVFAPGDSMDAWVQRADQALYLSKTSGRNRATLFTK
ncbi:diguanylate cyclase [Marinicella sp. W31]|uniref:tetratricopeptide repeat-containing diguanylate cyclase n=1 Tax=Marinicella sp. W31 TaxID=3023713 RepID=UPI0037578923